MRGESTVGSINQDKNHAFKGMFSVTVYLLAAGDYRPDRL